MGVAPGQGGEWGQGGAGGDEAGAGAAVAARALRVAVWYPTDATDADPSRARSQASLREGPRPAGTRGCRSLAAFLSSGSSSGSVCVDLRARSSKT